MKPRAVLEVSSPQIDDSRCVHSVLTNASCSSCVQACPRQAIVLNDECLGIDESACNTCGVCVTACPVSAIEVVRGEIALTSSGNHHTAYVGCRQCEQPSQLPRISCVHALGLRDLVGLYQRGVRRLIAQRTCANCHPPASDDLNATPSVSLSATVEQFNQLAESRQLARIDLDVTAAEQWNELAGRALGGDLPGNRSRRALFLKLLPDVAALDTNVFNLDAVPADDLPPASECVNPDSSPADGSALFAAVPHIDAQKCNGCDACCRICPSGALDLIQDDPCGLHYQLAADKCTGCGLCVDVCEREATSLAHMQAQECHQIALISATCRLCGADYHLPKESGVQDHLCQICRDHNHMSNLYQVLS